MVMFVYHRKQVGASVFFWSMVHVLEDETVPSVERKTRCLAGEAWGVVLGGDSSNITAVDC